MRYPADALCEFAARVLQLHSMRTDIARNVSEVLIEGDLLGHTTHGLQLLPRYLQALRGGQLALAGVPEVVADHGSGLLWDGGYLPGGHLMRLAIDEAVGRLARHPTVAIVLRRSGHIGCLAVYALAIAERGYFGLLCSSDPAVAPVAPFGATEGKLTPNPMAAGWPTEGDPVFLDVSASTTTAGMVGRAARTGTMLQGKWLIDADGEATDDPAAVQDGGGAILSLGALDLGHKGFALALMVEALTASLGGLGRADGVTQDGAAVFLQIIDPARFGGAAQFRRESEWLASACTGARTIPGGEKVRMPGARGLALKRRQLLEGIALAPDTQAALTAIAADSGLPLPTPLSGN